MAKRVMTLVFALVVLGGLTAAAAEIEPAASIQNITVYPDSAMIKKQAVFSVTKGQNVVRISGITSNLVDASVQASLKGGAGVKIADVKVEKTYLAKVGREKSEKLKARLETLEATIKTNTDEIAALNGSIDFLKRITPFPQNQRTTPSEVDAHVKFLTRSLTDHYKKIAEVERTLKPLQEEKKAVEKELENLKSLADDSKSVVLYLYSQADRKDLTLVLSYVVGGAGWLAQYDVRADSGARVAVDCFATVKQSTGEDWKGVGLEISTAKPFVYGVPPELSPWTVDIYQPPRPVRYKASSMAQGAPMARMAERESEAAADYEQPEVRAEASSFSFVLPGKVDVPADRQPHRFLIASAARDAVFNYRAVPKLSKYSYLMTDFKSPFDFPLVPGRMNLFLDDRLVGSASLDKTMLPGETLALSLGIDEGVKVERKPVKKFTEYAGTFTKETRVGYEYTIDVFNGKNRDIALAVSDNLPVSRNELIKVVPESPKNEGAATPEDGIMTWNLKLAAGEKKTLKIKYRVEYPKDLRVTGLE